MTDAAQNTEIMRLLRQQAVLARFGSYAFREPALSNILSEAARLCAESLDVPFCKVVRFREAENDLLVEAGYGWDAGVIGRVVSKVDETTPHGRAFITGKLVILEDLRTATNVVLPDFYTNHGIISTIDVIIKSKDGLPYGILEIDSPIFHVYDSHDVHFLTGFANVLAEAVATVNRNQIVRETIKRMETLVVEKEQALDDRSIMAEELKHRVRNNLQLIHGMLISHLRIASSREEKASAHAILRRVMTLAEVYEQLLGTGMGRVIELGEYLKALCARLPALQQSANSSVTLTCDAPPLLVDIDTVSALGMVVAELISNSFEHAFDADGGMIYVKLSNTRAGRQATLMIGDDGRGFVEQAGNKRHGVGLVRRLMEQIHGRAEVKSEIGTVWTLHFPVALPVEDAAGLPMA